MHTHPNEHRKRSCLCHVANCFAPCLLVCVALATLPANATPLQPGSEAQSAPTLVAPDPGNEMYILTDRPLYRPGDTIRFRLWHVRMQDLRPASVGQELHVELVDPRGSKVQERNLALHSWVSAGSFDLGKDIAGGRYLVRARAPSGDIGERSVVVSTFETPAFKKSITFGATSYGANDPVTFTVQIARAAAGRVQGLTVQASLFLDGRDIWQGRAVLDATGRATFHLRLPQQIASGNGLVTVIVTDNGASESLQTRLPLVLKNVRVSFFPEGGELVQGLASRVYFAARDSLDKPVRVKGVIVDDLGHEVGRLTSMVRGMGRFVITPKAGRSYVAKLVAPESAAASLPAAKPQGCVLSVDAPGKGARQLAVRVTCSQSESLIVAAVQRGVVLGQIEQQARAATPVALELPLPANRPGAVRLTLFGTGRRPLAERLVYAGRDQNVRVTIAHDKQRYAPRESVRLTVRTQDSSGRGVPADLALSVVDDAVLKLADDKAGHILSQLYLQAEMPGQKIDDPNFFFSNDPDAAVGMDLLMGTQGWRRFTWTWRPRR